MVRLWDCRSLECARTFAGHLNSQLAMRPAPSPCGRFLAVPSEDQSLHLYDLRNGGVVERVREVRGGVRVGVAHSGLAAAPIMRPPPAPLAPQPQSFQGLSAVPTAVAINPCHSQLACGGLDGHVRFFADR